MDETNERWCEAEVNRVGGELALLGPKPDEAKAETYFKRALAGARQQQAKSWELRAAMSMARLWRDQGKRTKARDLLAPVYGWFTEGFDTRDLKEAKALLDDLSSWFPSRAARDASSATERHGYSLQSGCLWGSGPAGYPAEPLVSYRINRQLSGWNLPPLMIRAFGAHGQKANINRAYSNAKMRFQSFFMLITVQPSFFAWS
jgi:hypothetical protein